ncbi:MAG: hypothetical protein EBT45_05005 [Alphaproteobacteria bacterium]|nr:hypothetical protein [Alphaproteobacteria bacterium]
MSSGIIFMRKQNLILLTVSLFVGSFEAFGEAEVHEKLPLKDSIQSNILTIYKDATLIQQTRSISTETGKDGNTSFQGVPNTICPESLMITSAAKEGGFEISEFSLAPTAAGASDLGVILSFKNTTSNLLKQIQLLYLFKNLGWHIDYALYFSANYEDVKLNAWIAVNNKSGVGFSKSQIQFVDCLIPASFVPLNPSIDSVQAEPSHKGEMQTSSEPAHAYVCDQLVDIPANGIKRISWVNSLEIKAKQDYRLFVGGAYLDDMEGKSAHPIVETWISFQNTKEQTLGMPLPKGEVTLYNGDEKGAIEVLGKAFIPHTAVGQEVSVKVPATQAEKNFSTPNDDKALRTFETELEQTEFKKLSDKITESSYRLNLKNKANQPITIRVTLDLPQGEWTVVRENISHQQNGDQQVFWTIQIGANSEVDLKYRVRLIRN